MPRPIIFFELEDGCLAEICVSRERGPQLAQECFRGRQCREAGNFFAWNHFQEFLQDEEARALLAGQLQELIRKNQDLAGVQDGEQSQHTVQLTFSRCVGWDWAVHTSALSPEDLGACELRTINVRACALFLPMGRIKAPRTESVTITLQMSYDRNWKFTIGDMHPGEGCRELRGHVTEIHDLVFFSRSNPGA